MEDHCQCFDPLQFYNVICKENAAKLLYCDIPFKAYVCLLGINTFNTFHYEITLKNLRFLEKL